MINDGSRAACEVSSVKEKARLKNNSSAGLKCAGGNWVTLSALLGVRRDNNHCGQFTCHISRCGGVTCRSCWFLLSTSSGQCVNRLLKPPSLFRVPHFYRKPKINYRSRTGYSSHTSRSSNNNSYNIRQWSVVCSFFNRHRQFIPRTNLI